MHLQQSMEIQRVLSTEKPFLRFLKILCYVIQYKLVSFVSLRKKVTEQASICKLQVLCQAVKFALLNNEWVQCLPSYMTLKETKW